MNYFKFALAVLYFAIGIAVAILGPASSSLMAQEVLDPLKSIPADAGQVMIINMPQLLKSPLYARLLREEGPLSSLTTGLKSFSMATGVDLAHDISSIIMSSSGQSPIMVAVGRFDYARINKYLQCSMHPEEENYNNASLLKYPMANGMSIAFLSPQEIAVGNVAPLKILIDTRAGLKRNIYANSLMSLLLKASREDVMFRVASRSISVLSAFGIPYPVPGSIDADIKGIAGAIDISEAISGKLTIIANEEYVAIQAMTTWNASAFWRRPDASNVIFPLLMAGLNAYRTGSQIVLSVDFQKDALKQYWNAKSGSSTSQTVLPPIPFLKPMPPYTKEAQEGNIRGILRMQLTVQKDGTPADVKILNGLGHGLDESAISIVADLWRFMPAIRDGAPMESQLIMDIPFNPEDHRWQ
jgi:hypothetical protein